MTAVPETDEITAEMDVLERKQGLPRHLVADNGYDTAAQQTNPFGYVSFG